MKPGAPVMFGHLALHGERHGTVRRVYEMSGTVELAVDFLPSDHPHNPLGKVVDGVPAFAARHEADLGLTYSGVWHYCYPR